MWISYSQAHTRTRTHKDFMNRTCQVVSVVNPTHILQFTIAHDCTEYHLQSVNENLFLSNNVEKVLDGVLWSWNRPCPDPYPSYKSPPFHLLSTHLKIYAWRWVNFGILKNLAKILTVCWNLHGPSLYSLPSRPYCQPSTCTGLRRGISAAPNQDICKTNG